MAAVANDCRVTRIFKQSTVAQVGACFLCCDLFNFVRFFVLCSGPAKAMSSPIAVRICGTVEQIRVVGKHRGHFNRQSRFNCQFRGCLLQLTRDELNDDRTLGS